MSEQISLTLSAGMTHGDSFFGEENRIDEWARLEQPNVEQLLGV
jgi:hypothetical protein